MSACAYCGKRRGIHQDHVIPRTLAKRRKGLIPAALLVTVACCGECNWLKSTRKLVPPSWADRIPALKEAIPGPWRTWDGDPKAEAFVAVHL